MWVKCVRKKSEEYIVLLPYICYGINVYICSPSPFLVEFWLTINLRSWAIKRISSSKCMSRNAVVEQNLISIESTRNIRNEMGQLYETSRIHQHHTISYLLICHIEPTCFWISLVAYRNHLRRTIFHKTIYFVGKAALRIEQLPLLIVFVLAIVFVSHSCSTEDNDKATQYAHMGQSSTLNRLDSFYVKNVGVLLIKDVELLYLVELFSWERKWNKTKPTWTYIRNLMSLFEFDKRFTMFFYVFFLFRFHCILIVSYCSMKCISKMKFIHCIEKTFETHFLSFRFCNKILYVAFLRVYVHWCIIIIPTQLTRRARGKFSAEFAIRRDFELYLQFVNMLWKVWRVLTTQ